MQKSFSRLWEGYKTDKEALKARNDEVKTLRAMGNRVTSFTLRNQQKLVNDECVGVCTVYFLDCHDV